MAAGRPWPAKPIPACQLGRGHQCLLPAGCAYRFTAPIPGVLLIQTRAGALSVEKWADDLPAVAREPSPPFSIRSNDMAMLDTPAPASSFAAGKVAAGPADAAPGQALRSRRVHLSSATSTSWVHWPSNGQTRTTPSPPTPSCAP